jgi:hypothetical protein
LNYSSLVIYVVPVQAIQDFVVQIGQASNFLVIGSQKFLEGWIGIFIKLLN